MTLAGAFDAVAAALAAIPPAEWVAVLLGFGYLLLAVRQNAWCWACAIASSGIFLMLFARAGLVMQAALQVFYIAMGAYGWWAWRRGHHGNAALPVSRWPWQRHALAITALLLASAVNGWLVARTQGGLVPYVDACVAWVSVLATWLVARKVLENWLYWIVIDAVAAALYWSQGFHATAVLFVAYVAIAVRGYCTWRADFVGGPARLEEHASA
ncbi:MAG: nicotinamide riboside transporter PnuC [Steroidobacteraceae bacterium]|nr:nicotinamide riboside transporter PnuC [Steroidobacteraceae bacterium]